MPTMKATGKQEQALREGALWRNARMFLSAPARKAIITRYARKFMLYSPYDLEDYFSEAHLASYRAMQACSRNGEPEDCERYFWTLVKSAFSQMSTNPAQRDVIPGEDAGPMAVVFERYEEQEFEGETEGRPAGAFCSIQPMDRLWSPESIADILLARQVRAALAAMTVRQREVWSLMLEGRDTGEIANMLHISRQNVEKLRETGLTKVRLQIRGGCC